MVKFQFPPIESKRYDSADLVEVKYLTDQYHALSSAKTKDSNRRSRILEKMRKYPVIFRDEIRELSNPQPDAVWASNFPC